ncbi:uncharacterized protein ACBT44_008128 [Syngnathus typhle]
MNVDKTKEVVVDFRKGHTQHLPLTIDGAVVERVSSARFLGVHISEDLSWSTNTASLAKKAQRRLYFLRKLRRASAPPAVMTTFYRGTIESVLSSCIAVWGGGCTEYNLKALQHIVNTAGKIIGASLPSLKDIYISHLTRKATTIVSDVSHPAHSLLSFCPLGRGIGACAPAPPDSTTASYSRLLGSRTRYPFLRSVLYFCATLTACCMHTGSVLLLLFIMLSVYLLFIHHSYYLLFVPSCFYIVSFTCMLLPAYRQMVRASRPVRKRVRVWPEGASDALCDCFGSTDWDMFRRAATCDDRTDIEEYTDSVSFYIRKCIDDVTHSKSIVTRANRKPWLTGAVFRLLRARDKAFRAGDEAGLRTASADLSQGIKEAKRAFSCKITAHFKDGRDAWSLWQGIQTITDYKPAPQSCEGDVRLLNDLNRFFARFDAQNSTCPLKATTPSHELPLSLSANSVRRALVAINIRKAAGPDNISGRALKDCAGELTDVFTDIFNTSLHQAIVPLCFKAATIVPVLKKPAPSCFNDYRPVALTPIIMKCFERLVMEHIRSVPPPPPLIPSSLRTEPSGPLRMPSALPSNRPSPTWREGTRM